MRNARAGQNLPCFVDPRRYTLYHAASFIRGEHHVNKPAKRAVSGILLLDKPCGISSNAALQKVKWLFNARKAGHTGSLDPLASGLLPICLGEATKFSQFLLDAGKRYVVTAKLGEKTTTADAEGEVIAQKPVPALNTIQLEQVLQQFRGEIEQIPSMFSALKHKGQPLYKLARQGKVIEREPRRVMISALRLLELRADEIELDVCCSKGTYIRTLVEDIGEMLGCGAHVTVLRRLEVAHFMAEQMITIEQLQSLAEQGYAALDKQLLAIETAVQGHPSLHLSEAAWFCLSKGQRIKNIQSLPVGWVCLRRKDGRFAGMGEIMDNGTVVARRLLQQISAPALAAAADGAP